MAIKPQQAAAIASENDWSLGVDSYTHYARLGKGYVCWLVNCLNRGGMIQTRPGKRLILNLNISGEPQGICLFRPTPSYGVECMLWAVNGQIYLSRYPFRDYTIVNGLNFDPTAPMIRFCAGKKVSALAGDGTLSLLSQPYNVLIIQDGRTPAGVFDGAAAQGYHIFGGAPGFGTQMGLHMCWSGNRLWVAFEDSVYASDYLDPLTFSDSTYLATADNFKLPFPCNGMIETPDERTLLAFCDTAIVSFQSQIADRTMWQNVTDFQKIVVPDTGAVAARSIFNQFGTTWFLSEFGFTNLNMAQGQAGTDRIPPKDVEMMRSKDNLSSDRSGACGVAFESFALLSVPSGSVDNKHTWVMDAAPQARVGSQITMFSPLMGTVSWCGVWTGTYPIDYACDIVQGETRCFELAKNCTMFNGSHLNIWENFVGQRHDYTGTPIQCIAELRCFDFGTDRYTFRNVEVDLAEIWGEVTFEIWYAGVKGNFQKICSKTIEAEMGIFRPELQMQYDDDPLTDTILESWRPQTRTIRSEEVSGAAEEDADFGPLCGPESPYQINIDKGFQILFRWTGACGIRQVRLYADPYLEPRVGKCEPDEVAGTNVLIEIADKLPSPKPCIPAIVQKPPLLTPFYLLHTTGQPVVNATYELYVLSQGTPIKPTIATKLGSWILGRDVLPGFPIDYSDDITAYAGSQTFYWLFRMGTGQPVGCVMNVNVANPIADVTSGLAQTTGLLGVDTFYVTFANVDRDNYQITHLYSPPTPAAPLYTLDTANYRIDTYANVTTDANYQGVIKYPALGFQVYQLMTTYQPGSNTVQSQTMQLRGSGYEGTSFKVGDMVNITPMLDLKQFPFEFTVVRSGQAPSPYTQDLWALAGAGNMQLGIESASNPAVIVHADPPAALPGVWIAAAQTTLLLNESADPTKTQIAMSLSPSGSQKLMIGFYWPNWDWGIAQSDSFFAGPCGIEVRDYSDNILQDFVYNRDFGPDGSVTVIQYIDMTALFQSTANLKLLRYSYYGGATKKVVIDGDSQGNGSFELGEATIMGAKYPTNAAIQKVAVAGAANQHKCGIATHIGTDLFVFCVQNVSTKSRYS